MMHDLSKYSPSEFIPGVKYYQDGHRSPNNAQREDEGVSKAWMHNIMPKPLNIVIQWI